MTKTIKPRINDIVQWNGSCSITSRVTSILPDGVVVQFIPSKKNFLPHGSYRVVSESKQIWLWWCETEIAHERLAEGLWDFDKEGE